MQNKNCCIVNVNVWSVYVPALSVFLFYFIKFFEIILCTLNILQWNCNERQISHQKTKENLMKSMAQMSTNTLVHAILYLFRSATLHSINFSYFSSLIYLFATWALCSLLISHALSLLYHQNSLCHFHFISNLSFSRHKNSIHTI